MTTSQETSFLSDVLSGERIPVWKLAYFRQSLRNVLYDAVVTEFMRQRDESDLSQAELARRIGKRPEVVNRLLGSPGNWTLDTVSDLLLGMGAEPMVSVSHLGLLPARNFNGPEWLEETSSVIDHDDLDDDSTSTVPSVRPRFKIRKPELADA